MSATRSAVDTLCEEFWAWRMRTSPEFATYCGDHEYADRLDDYSLEAFAQRYEDAKAFLDRCTALSEVGGLSADDDLNLNLLKQQLVTYVDGYKFSAFVLNMGYAEGIHVDFEQTKDYMRFKLLTDFEMYVKRLKALPMRVRQSCDLLKHGVTLGITQHKVSMEGVVDGLADLQKYPKETVFYEPFLRDINGIQKSEIERLGKEAEKIIKEDIQPAFKEMQTYISEEYMNHLRSVEGASSLPNGEAFYNACLEWHLSLPLTAQEVHDIGLKEIERIKTEMHQVVKKTGFEGDLKAFVSHLRNDERHFYKTKEELMAGFEDVCTNKIRPRLLKLFHHIPDSKLILEKVPDSRPNAPVGYYLAGTLDGTRPGKFYVNLHNLKMTYVIACYNFQSPKYEMMTLSLHEGEPGHHFQGMYAIELKGVPTFRQYLEDMNYNIAPSRFPLNTAYCEGWGLYCEYLGNELGLYDDPYTMFGHLSFEMHRACRLVVDTGMHALGWSFDQAVALLMENTALSELFIQNEVKRYITWPGQACAYKIGQLKIQELRKKAEDKLGERFDVRDFHEEELRALMVPLPVLEDLIDKYIKEKLH